MHRLQQERESSLELGEDSGDRRGKRVVITEVLEEKKHKKLLRSSLKDSGIHMSNKLELKDRFDSIVKHEGHGLTYLRALFMLFSLLGPGVPSLSDALWFMPVNY